MAFARKQDDDVVSQIRDRAESDLLFFAKLVGPHRVYGGVHEELFTWWPREGAKDNQLVLLPRDHQKSHCAAVKAAWDLTRDPTATILYVSATSDLAEKQLYAIKNILDSEVYRRYWPDMLHTEEGKRERWTTGEIIVDHPLRKTEGVRDPSIKAAGLTTNITGFHASHVYLDDVVVPNNAYTSDGRHRVAALYSQLASIETTGAKETVVGTRYHPKDLYDTLLSLEEDTFDDDGELVGSDNVYEIFQRVVETDGEFLWPKQQRPDGKYFGFNQKELARKKAKYVDKTQFFAQYYNDPNDPSSEKISNTLFQHYDRKFIEFRNGFWHYKNSKLNVFASIDFAFSLRQKADFTALVTVGVDSENNIYVLDIDRFKTDKISEYFRRILKAHQRWGFRKLRAEVTVAQQMIVRELKDNYIKPNGIVLSIDEYRPTRHEGSKEERIMATLEPRYSNHQIWHYKGGYCQILEEELTMAHPPHDDIMDALTAAIDIAVAPRRASFKKSGTNTNVVFHSRFGGVAH